MSLPKPSPLSPQALLLGLVAPICWWIFSATQVISSVGIPYDTEYTYLPMARQMIEDLPAFWHSQDLLQTAPGAPGAPAMMALLGADMANINAFNMVLGVLSILMLFDTVRRLAAPWAGGLTAWCFALSPALMYWSAYPMGEPYYIAFICLWLWLTACYCQAPAAQPRWRTWSQVALAGIALTLAVLTRATYMYWLGFASIAFALVGWWLARKHKPQASVWRRIAVTHLIALVLVGAYVVRNQHEFGVPAVAVGAGNALYLGSNPMFRGQEPVYFDVMWDNKLVTDGLSQLTVRGDALLTDKAKLMLKTLPANTVMSMYFDKAGSLLFGSRSHLKNYTYRAWRISLITLAITAFVLAWRRPFVLLVFGATLYQWAVHTPALYNQRYSATALDIGLTILAALGISQIAYRWPNSKIKWPALCALLLALISAGAVHQRYSSPSLPLLTTVPHTLAKVALPLELGYANLSANPWHGLSSSPSGQFQIEWDTDHLSIYGLYTLRLQIKQLQGECKRARILHRLKDGGTRSERINIQGMKQGQDFTWGLNGLGYEAQNSAGKLTLEFECTPGVFIQLGELAVYDATPSRNFN